MGAARAFLSLAVRAALLVVAGGSSAQEGTNLVMQLGHSEPVSAIAFAPDGRMAASAAREGGFKFWDVETGRELRTVFGRRDISGISSLAFSPDGRQLLSSDKGKLTLWDVATGEKLRGLTECCARTPVFSPDGKYTLIMREENKPALVDVATGLQVRIFTPRASTKPKGNSIDSLAFSPDGRHAASRSSFGTINIWEVSTGRELRAVDAGNTIYTDLAFSPDGRHILSGENGALKLWEVATGEAVRSFVEEGSTSYRDLHSPIFCGGGRYVVAVDRGILIWDASSGRQVAKLPGNRSQPGPWTSRVACPADGQYVLSSANGEMVVRLWNVATGQEVRTFSGYGGGIYAVATSPDGSLIISGGANKLIHVWDTSTGRLLRSITEDSKIRRLKFLPDGSHFISSADTIKIRDVASGSVVRTLTNEKMIGYEPDTGQLALSKDNRFLAGQINEGLRIWETASWQVVRTLDRREIVSALAIALSPDGTYLAASDSNENFRLWEVATGRVVRTISRGDWISAAAFTPDGRRVVSVGRKHFAVWDVETSRQLWAFNSNDGYINSIVLSPDGKHVLSAGGDRTARLWDLPSGREVAALVGHGGNVNSVAFLPNGRRIVTASFDGTVGLWAAADGKPLARAASSSRGDWLTITQAGFFDRGGTGELPLHLVRNLTTLSVDQVFEYLYRPDLVESLLGGDAEGKYKDAAHSLNLETVLHSGPPPQLDHLADKSERIGDTVRLNVRVTGQGGGIGKRIVWRVNGVSQGSSTPSVLVPDASPLASVVVTETLKLLPGQANQIEVTAYNGSGLVATTPLKITVDNFGTTTAPRPRMFVLAVGVDTYRMKDYRLSFAAHDALSFAKALAVVGASLFDEVRPITLTETQVNEADIAKAFDAIARQAKPNDVFVLFLGGHGKSIAGRYYYYPQTIDFAVGHTVETNGIGQDKWESWLAKIPVQKSLLIIDTCEGDAFRGSRGTDSSRQAAMAQLQHATGRNIIAASRDAAYEGYRGHGVLTYAILEALGEAASHKGDEVRVTALADYIGVRVPEISKSTFGVLQNPTRKLAGSDFPIGIRRSVLAIVGDGPAIAKDPTHVMIREELLREKPATDAPSSRPLAAGTRVRAVEYVGTWVIIARDGQKLGYVPADALARMQ
jgi:WD40 repeat protein